MHTYASALALAQISVPAHINGAGVVPILVGLQAQGDLLFVPFEEAADGTKWTPVPGDGVPLVRAAGTGNTHWLHRGLRSLGVAWSSAHGGTLVALIRIPRGQSALVLHTEHGANGIGPGLYAVHRKRRRVWTDESLENPTIAWVDD